MALKRALCCTLIIMIIWGNPLCYKKSYRGGDEKYAIALAELADQGEESALVPSQSDEQSVGVFVAVSQPEGQSNTNSIIEQGEGGGESQAGEQSEGAGDTQAGEGEGGGPPQVDEGEGGGAPQVGEGGGSGDLQAGEGGGGGESQTGEQSEGAGDTQAGEGEGGGDPQGGEQETDIIVNASPTPIPVIPSPIPGQSENQTSADDSFHSIPTPNPEAGETIEAWAQYNDGLLIKGRAQDVLDYIGLCETNKNELPVVYICTTQIIRLENTSEAFLQRIKLIPDENVFYDPSVEYVVVWRTIDDTSKSLPPIEIWVSASSENTPLPSCSPSPNPSESPVPKPNISVEVSEYKPNEWKAIAPVFTLSGITEDMENYIYGVFVCNERLIVLSRDTNIYVPEIEGNDVTLRFAILDMLGDVVSFSDEFSMMLDFTPPNGPFFNQIDDHTVQIAATDTVSGVKAISTDGGLTWVDISETTQEIIINGEPGKIISPQTIVVKDFAENIASNKDAYLFPSNNVGPSYEAGYQGSGGSGGGSSGGDGKKPIKHVRETMDYSLNNYNALDLSFPSGPQTALVAGEETLNLSLSINDRPAEFVVELGLWDAKETEQASSEDSYSYNLLTLTAQSKEDEPCTWTFSGEVYRLLYNSHIDYLVFKYDQYITVLPTCGFTAGTQYAQFKASGTPTRQFEYSLIQDKENQETNLFVFVGGEIYELTEERDQPMYRVGVLIGQEDLLERPYESYLPKGDVLKEVSE